jgi:hypothetical protein
MIRMELIGLATTAAPDAGATLLPAGVAKRAGTPLATDLSSVTF